MPWTNQSGGGSGSDNNGPIRGPWGGGPSRGGGGGMRPPDLDDLLRRIRRRIADLFPQGLGRNGLIVAALAVFALWLASGIYFVQANEKAVVLRFGRLVAQTDPGLHYRLPWPIEGQQIVQVTTANQINIGYKQITDSNDAVRSEDIPDESLMLTGDENIVDINFTVYWNIKNPADYLFHVEGTPETIKAVAESAMREVVGQNQIEVILTSNREKIQIAVRKLIQKTLDLYGAGVIVTSVNMQKAEPPDEVRAAYLDVQAALADQDRKRNEAEAYANTIVPQARGNAAHIVQDAEAYRQQAIASATGDAKRFLSVFVEYKKAPEVTRRRIYLETMTHVLAPMNKVIVDDSAKGVVPYFQLPSMLKPAPATTDAMSRPPQGTQIPQASSAPQGGDQ